ncbi:hypothetical protein GQ44DRAFT_774643 [Phaeosphaeriaceae sp. PMI808]|nr:hypothetical protein GQ44DRAFT_774643 [Phaeosphaeriaceae sp. PMI808]
MLNDIYLSELPAIFPDFAKALFDSEIYYTAPSGPFNGRKVRPDYDIFFPQNTWTVASGATTMLTASTEPFGINRYTLRIRPKESIALRFRPAADYSTLVNCENREVSYEFLYTYTGKDVQAGAGGRQIQVQATKMGIRKRQETCEPQPAPTIEIDRCLLSKWKTDPEKTKSVLKERLETNMRIAGITATASEMTITGSAVCDIDQDLNNHWIYDNLQMKFIMTSTSLPTAHTTIDIQGEMTAKIMSLEQNRVFMWKERRNSITAKSSTITPVLSEPVNF